MGKGTLFTVTGGSYFIDGFIVRNDEQTITLNKYDLAQVSVLVSW